MYDLKDNLLLNFKRGYSFYNYMMLREVSRATPLYINIDVTNACNYKCTMCPQSDPDSNVKRGFIEDNLFKKIISDVKEFMPVEQLCLFLAGEPLLHKELEFFVKLVKDELGIRPNIASNISLLTPERTHNLIEAGLGSVVIDFCEDKETFEQFRKGAIWADTYGKLELLIETKKKMGSKYPKITLKDISTGRSDPDEDERFNALKSLFGKGEINSFLKYKFHNWGGLVSEDADNESKYSNDYHPCSHLWFNMPIQYDGKVSACCRDAEGKLIMGDANEKSLKEIWNDTPIVNLRRALIRKEYKDIQVCNNCDRLWTGGYFGGSPLQIIKRWIKSQPGGFRFSIKK